MKLSVSLKGGGVNAQSTGVTGQWRASKARTRNQSPSSFQNQHANPTNLQENQNRNSGQRFNMFIRETQVKNFLLQIQKQKHHCVRLPAYFHDPTTIYQANERHGRIERKTKQQQNLKSL